MKSKILDFNRLALSHNKISGPTDGLP